MLATHLAALILAAPPTVTGLFPAGGQRGTTVTVVSNGTFEKWPVRIWTDRPGLMVEPAKDKGKLTVTVAADAGPGLCWLRLIDDQGASELIPFAVGVLPEIAEVEPNDEPKSDQPLGKASVTVNARLDKRGDTDVFAVPLKKGQTLVASVAAARLGSPMDAHLQILSPAGFVLAENNDTHGLDPQLIFPVPADGAYRVRVFAFPATPSTTIQLSGGPEYIYRLTLTTGPVPDHASPSAVTLDTPGKVGFVGWNIPADASAIVHPGLGLAPLTTTNEPLATFPGAVAAVPVRLESHPVVAEVEPNGIDQPQRLTAPVTICGRIDTPNDVDAYRLTLEKGKRYEVRLEARVFGSPLDGLLRVTDPNGKTTELDDVGQAADPVLIVPGTGGDFTIAVHDLYSHGGLRHVYRLRISTPGPDYDLSVSTDRLALESGKTIEVAATALPLHGFKGTIEMTAEGLPPGVTAESVAGKSVLKLTAAEGTQFSGPIRIVGTSGDLKRLARFKVAKFETVTDQVWLTVSPTAVAPPPPPKKKR